MMRKPSWIFLGAALWLSNQVVACAHRAEGSDAGPPDAGIDGDLDPCQAAAPVWNDIWKFKLEQTPLTGNTPDINLIDVWGTAANDIYAVGFKGAILHYDGSQWVRMPSQTENDLQGIWGYQLKDQNQIVVKKDIFAVGSNGTILRYNDTVDAWAPQQVINDPDPANPNPQPVTDTFHDVWGLPAPSKDQQPTVIAVGEEGLIVQFDPTLNEFKEMRERVEFQYDCDDAGVCHKTRISYQRWSPERLGGVFGTGSNQFVAAGNNGTILEYNGSIWDRQDVRAIGGGSAFTTHLSGVWGRGAGEMFVVGLDGTVIRGTYGSWEQLDLNLPKTYLRSVWAFGQNKCGDIPDGGTQPQDTSWVFFSGWDGTLLLAHDSLVCPLGDITLNRLEGMWGTAPRSEQDRTLPDGGVECDPVEAFITGVNATIVRLSDEKGR